jgi:hypothetical protein
MEGVMKLIKKRDFFTVLAVVAVVAFAVCVYSFSNDDSIVGESSIPISRLHGSFTINVDDPLAVVGDADYVFVANVLEETETVYEDVVTVETASGAKEVGDPYTRYIVSVIENLKGNIEENVEVELLKAGGISQDNDVIFLYEDDALLEVGSTYVLIAYAQPDGSLLVCGPNSSKIIEANSDRVRSNQTYASYVTACENQVVTSRERYTSVYEDQSIDFDSLLD